MRDFNHEFGDHPHRRYAYNFDGIIRSYLLRAVRPYLVPTARSLELGCFKGDMTHQILDEVGDLTVVEASSELCDHVRERFGRRVEIVCATIEEVALPSEYANVFFVHTLEHVDDPVAALRRIGTWLAPRGRLIVAVPNAHALSRQIAVRMGLVPFETSITPAELAHGHRRTYTMDLLEHHLREAQLTIVHRGGVLVKGLANRQFDEALGAGIVDERYLDACFDLGVLYPGLCATIYAVCEGCR